MKKLENLFDSYKGLVLFYLIVATLCFVLVKRNDVINVSSSSQKVTETRSYYA